jgi:hypothetical protein
MELDTTNISDLPINTNMPPNEQNEQIENMRLNTLPMTNDKEIVNNDFIQEKKVRFEDNMNPSLEKSEQSHSKQKDFVFEFKLEYKIIILATFFFFIFMDNKFKKYILNILVQIFGSYLKTELGNMTKLGLFVYSLCFGLLLTGIVSFIDFSSFHLAF